MLIHINNFLNYNKMHAIIPAVVLEQTQKTVRKFEDGKAVEMEGVQLEVKPDKSPGKNLMVIVYKTVKFEQYKKYDFAGDLVTQLTKAGKLFQKLDAETYGLSK